MARSRYLLQRSAPYVMPVRPSWRLWFVAEKKKSRGRLGSRLEPGGGPLHLRPSLKQEALSWATSELIREPEDTLKTPVARQGNLKVYVPGVEGDFDSPYSFFAIGMHVWGLWDWVGEGDRGWHLLAEGVRFPATTTGKVPSLCGVLGLSCTTLNSSIPRPRIHLHTTLAFEKEGGCPPRPTRRRGVAAKCDLGRKKRVLGIRRRRSEEVKAGSGKMVVHTYISCTLGGIELDDSGSDLDLEGP
ncbi:hypothetical protein EDD18DRAFT_1115200 [Armillaria luteobubalina]|uniref:Uncharacterized protein n=1 Tax=Armillaria luteobubalina TaxID=153913 RepID=A0AA39P4R9_9AGAR|nr:hypothetical protein EDD18DRAFT_1115200 [Armillaria luteobubalina]